MGYTEQEFDRPIVAVINSWNEYNPGHVHLRTLSERVKQGIREAGGLCVPAHINRGSSGVLGALGFLPQGVHYDALEVSPAAPLTADVTGYRLLRSSDAHSLEQMLEREFALEAKTRSVDAVFDAIAGRTQPD